MRNYFSLYKGEHVCHWRDLDILNLEPLYDYVLFSWDLYLYYTIRLFRFDVIQYADRIKLQKEKWWTYFQPIVSYIYFGAVTWMNLGWKTISDL